jgi:hypothetical protein
MYTKYVTIIQGTHANYSWQSQIVKWLLIASPFLALRTAYGILGIFNATGAHMFTSIWSSLFGSATALALMGLLPEYIVICIYLYILHYRVRTCSQVKRLSDGGYLLSEQGRA